MEFHSIYRQHIPFILLTQNLLKMFDARAVLFKIDDRAKVSRLPILVEHARRIHQLHPAVRLLFRSSGIRHFIFPSLKAHRNFAESEEIFDLKLKNRTREEVESLSISGMLVGDLLYDDFLSKGHKTVNSETSEFREHAIFFLANFFSLLKYFDSNPVVAVVTNHVYRQGLVARIANHRGIPTYEAGLTRLARITLKHPALSESMSYRNLFRKLTTTEQKRAEVLSKDSLRKFRAGTFRDYTNWHLPELNASKDEVDRISQIPGKKVLLALHCLSDSPHVRGKSLFPDNYAWIKESIDSLNGTGVTLVVKPHPACPGDDSIGSLAKKNPAVHFVDSSVSLKDLKSAGISQVVTFYGNISFEAALLGIEAINLTFRNPHSGYSFGFVPENRAQYFELIGQKNFSGGDYPNQEILEYFYMSRFYWNQDIFFDRTAEVSANARLQDSPGDWLLREFCRVNSDSQFMHLMEEIRNFVAKGDQRAQIARMNN